MIERASEFDRRRLLEALGSCALALPIPPSARVVAIAVTHLPLSIATRTRLTLEALHASPEAIRATLRDPASIARCLALERASFRTAPSAAPFDARWDVIAYAAGQRIVRRVVCDGFGVRGEIDGRPVWGRARALVRFLERRVPAFEPRAPRDHTR